MVTIFLNADNGTHSVVRANRFEVTIESPRFVEAVISLFAESHVEPQSVHTIGGKRLVFHVAEEADAC